MDNKYWYVFDSAGCLGKHETAKVAAQQAEYAASAEHNRIHIMLLTEAEFAAMDAK